MSEDGVECESFTIIFIGSLLVYDNKLIMITIYLDHYDYEIVEQQVTDYLGGNIFEIDED